MVIANSIKFSARHTQHYKSMNVFLTFNPACCR